MLFNQMVCPEEINEEKVKEEQEELCAKLIMLSRYPEFKLFSLPFLSAFFLKLSPKLFNNEFVYRFLNNNKVIATLPYEIIRNIPPFLLSSEEKLGKDIEGKIKESLGKKKVKVSNVVFKDGKIEELTVTIGGIKHEE